MASAESKVVKNSEIISIMNSMIQELNKSVEELTEQSISEPPDFDDIRNDIEIRYNSYMEVANRCRKVAELLLKAYFLKDSCRRLKVSFISDNKISKALLTTYLKDLEHSIEDCDGIINALKADKEGADQLLKFYNSMQYLFGSCLDVKSQY